MIFVQLLYRPSLKNLLEKLCRVEQYDLNISKNKNKKR